MGCRLKGTATNGVEMQRSREIAFALAVSNCLVRRIIIEPRQRDVRVDSGDVDELVRVHDSKTSIVEFDNFFLAQISKHPIDMNIGETGGIPDVLLGQRQMHFFDVMTRPSDSIADEKFEEQMRDTLSCRTLANVGQMVVRETPVL